MMTRGVALTRALLVTVVLWAAGIGITYGLFKLAGGQTTIKDLPGHADRVQIVWWGAHAFCACVAALVGSLSGAMALMGAYITEARGSLAWTALPVLAVGALALVALVLSDVIGQTLFLAGLIGLAIGVAGATAFVLTNGVRDEPDAFYAAAPRRRTGQSWGSR